MADHVLDVLLHSRHAGALRRKDNGNLQFRYDPAYIESGGPPLSLSLPLRTEAFPHRACLAFFGNLLPEEGVRTQIALATGISAANDYGLLARFGGDVGGRREGRGAPLARRGAEQAAGGRDRDGLRPAARLRPSHDPHPQAGAGQVPRPGGERVLLHAARRGGRSAGRRGRPSRHRLRPALPDRQPLRPRPHPGADPPPPPGGLLPGAGQTQHREVPAGGWTLVRPGDGAESTRSRACPRAIASNSGWPSSSTS